VGALEPVVMSEIMSIHHSKHHNAYVTNLNAALEKYADAGDQGLGYRVWSFGFWVGNLEPADDCPTRLPPQAKP